MEKYAWCIGKVKIIYLQMPWYITVHLQNFLHNMLILYITSRGINNIKAILFFHYECGVKKKYASVAILTMILIDKIIK